MTPAEAIELIRRAGRANQIRYTGHARERMHERNVSAADVRAALKSAGPCRAGDKPDRWRVTGYDVDGAELVVVVVLEAGAVVITVHDA